MHIPLLISRTELLPYLVPQREGINLKSHNADFSSSHSSSSRAGTQPLALLVAQIAARCIGATNAKRVHSLNFPIKIRALLFSRAIAEPTFARVYFPCCLFGDEYIYIAISPPRNPGTISSFVRLRCRIESPRALAPWTII